MRLCDCNMIVRIDCTKSILVPGGFSMQDEYERRRSIEVGAGSEPEGDFEEEDEDD